MDSNHVPSSVDAYIDRALKEWFDDRDLATDLQLLLNKNRFASMGSNFCKYTNKRECVVYWYSIQ